MFFDYSKNSSILCQSKNIMKKQTFKSISIVLDPEILKKLEEGKYNKSKLIDSLLDSYFKNKKKKSS